MAILTLLDCSCSKKNNPTPPSPANNYKITLVSGNTQTGAIGYGLKDSIMIKVTDNGNAASNVQVQFIGSGCNEDLATNVNTKANGSASYYWTLSADQGQQTLRAVIIAGGKRIDSTNASATAVTAAALALPQKSACTPNPGSEATRILQLSTGRLLACFPGKTSIRYSDDDGVSWNPLTGFGSKHSVAAMAISPQDEIFVAAENEGVFYSKDAGNTWADISPPTFDKTDNSADIAYTSSGKLIFSGLYNDVFISTDKGSTWINSTGLNNGGSYTEALELNNGDMYILCGNNVLYKSTNHGQSWTPQNNRLILNFSAIYVDNKGWFYEASGISGSSPDIITVSKDNGATFTNLVTYTNPTFQPYINNISVQRDGLLYFGELSYAICRLPNPGQVMNYTLTQYPFGIYLVTKTNRFLYVNFGGIYYF
ncbi:MAG: hypothetical protein ACHQF4_11235 [Sphingobacteriales bacterium]